MTVEELVVSLGLNTDKFADGLKKAQSLASGFVSGIGMAFGQMFGGMIKEALNIVPRIFNVMKADVKALDELNKRTNASVEDIAAWGNAVELSGGSAKAFQGTLQHLYNDLSRIAITGRGRSKPFLEALGIDVASLKDKEIFDVIEQIHKSVQGMDSKTASYSLKNLGFDPDTIKFMLENDTKQLKELIKQQKEWGIYTKKDVEALDKLDKAVKKVRNVLKSMILPIFSTVIQLFARGAQYISKGITYLRENITLLRGILMLTIPALIKFGSAFLLTPIGMFITAITSLVLLLEDLWTYAKGGESYFKDFWKKFGKPDEVMAGFQKIGNTIARFFKFLGSLSEGEGLSKDMKLLMMLVGGISLLIIAIGTWVPVAIAAAVTAILYFWEEIEAFVKEVWKRFTELPDVIVGAFKLIGKIIVSIFTGILSFIGGIIGSIASVISSGIETVKEILSSVGEAISSAFQTAFDTVIGLWDSLVSNFQSGCNSIASFLSGAADSARNAWAGFIKWLEDKWNWLKELLPSFEKIAGSLPSLGGAPKLAMAGAGGGGNTTTITDNSTYTFNNHTKEASEASMQKSGVKSQADRGQYK